VTAIAELLKRERI